MKLQKNKKLIRKIGMGKNGDKIVVRLMEENSEARKQITLLTNTITQVSKLNANLLNEVIYRKKLDEEKAKLIEMKKYAKKIKIPPSPATPAPAPAPAPASQQSP
jgi:thiamine kinase-like enzyme